jgi:hypothetical protein
MNEEQENDMRDNIVDFSDDYRSKYIAGQKEHSGNLWEMGLKQVVGNAKEEVLDMWSYLMTIEKVIEEIEELCDQVHESKINPGTFYNSVDEILNRRKKD